MDRRNFLRDERAVSPIIGFMFVLVIVVSVMSFVQVRHVPVWNAEIEYKHVNAVYDEMRVLGSDITNVFNYQVSKMCPLHLGVAYPSRGIFYNPTDALIGTLTVNPEHTITVNYTKFDGTTGSETFPSCSLIYKSYGQVPHAKIVYEHGVVIRDYGIYGITTAGRQLLIGEDGNVNIPILNGTDRILTSKGVEMLTIEPYSGTEPVIGIHYVNITLTTNYPEVWKTILANANTSGTNATVAGNKIYINSTKKDRIRFIAGLTNWQSDRLYSGVIAITPAEEPVAYAGKGEGTVASGTMWKNIPSSDAITKLNITNIVVDEAIKDRQLDQDYIKLVVTDPDGDWWKVEINFAKPNKITSIEAKSGNTSKVSKYQGTPIVFDTTTTIDLLTASNYDKPDGCYQNAGIDDTNTLVTLLSDEKKPKDTALIYYYMGVK